MNIYRDTQPQRITTRVTLRNHWYEYITRDEALRRLERRPLPPEERHRIEREIPHGTHHFLTFHGGAFREYAIPDGGVGVLLLLLPLEAAKQPNAVVVLTPVHNSERLPDGGLRLISGIGRHEFSVIDGKLAENGVVRDTFRFDRGPTEIEIDASFLVSDYPHPTGDGWCCRACEWVHSALGIHEVDHICCLGGCKHKGDFPLPDPDGPVPV